MIDDDELTPIEEFFAKLDWEGGAYEALEYGLRSSMYDLPKEMSEQWDEIRSVFHELRDLVDDFTREWEPSV